MTLALMRRLSLTRAFKGLSTEHNGVRGVKSRQSDNLTPPLERRRRNVSATSQCAYKLKTFEDIISGSTDWRPVLLSSEENPEAEVLDALCSRRLRAQSFQ